MSENEAPDNEAIDDVLVDEAEEPATRAAKAEKKSGGGIVAWLALLIALAAAAGALPVPFKRFDPVQVNSELVLFLQKAVAFFPDFGNHRFRGFF